MFKPRFARKSFRRYRRKGLDKIERGMVASISAGGLDGARILEIGGGIGTIQAELLAAGASRGEIVELVSAYERRRLRDVSFVTRRVAGLEIRLR
jgi:hypothetical protein